MGDKTGIQWTDASWNPTVGCSIVSPGCRLCYAMGEAARQIRCAAGLKRETHYAGTVETKKGRPIWTGTIKAAPDHIWTLPLRWRRPRRIFVNSMSDLFHEDVPDAWIDRAFAIMVLSPQHTFQLLTKRSARMRRYLSADGVMRRIYMLVCDMVTEGDLAGEDFALIAPFHDTDFAPDGRRVFLDRWPLPNVWLGVSTERQQEADERIPDLLSTPAAVRFISAEPLLSRVTLRDLAIECERAGGRFLDWVIVGGESARLKDERPTPMHPNWVRDLRDECSHGGIQFFFKQWGDWHPDALAFTDARTGEHPPRGMRIGTKKAGRLLDGREHNDFPNIGGGNGAY